MDSSITDIVYVASYYGLPYETHAYLDLPELIRIKNPNTDFGWFSPHHNGAIFKMSLLDSLFLQFNPI